jgi:putative ABC transport system permease protein
VRLLQTAPWRRAPLLLLSRPVVFAGIAVASAVLALAASAGLLFGSTLGTASLRAQAAESCPESSMPTISGSVYLDPGVRDRLPDVNAAGVTALHRAGVPGDGYWVDISRSQFQATPVTLFARAGSLGHVHTLTPNRGQPGLWFPDDFATKIGVHPGQSVPMANGTVRVAGIYRALSPDPFHLAKLPRYWCTWSPLILYKLTGNGGTPPLLLADPQTLANTAVNVPNALESFVQVSWYAPAPIGQMTLQDVRDAAQRSGRASALLATIKPAGVDLATDTTVDLANQGNGNLPVTATPLDAEIGRAQRIQDGLSGSVLPISIAGTLVALLLVAEAGGSWAARRSREVRLLTARGVGPAAIGVKALLEALPAAVLGLGVGYGLSYLLMRTLGPAPAFGSGVPARAAAVAALAAAAGLLLIAVVGGRSARDARATGTVPRGYRRLARHLPYELLLVGVGVRAWLTIRSGDGISYTQNIITVGPLLLVFPLLALTGMVLLLGRGAALLVPRTGRLARALPAAGYLALRRISGSPAIAVGLLLGTALPCGLLAYAGTVSVGVHDELVRKYQTNLGAPDVLQLIGVHDATPNLAQHGTAVVLYSNGPTLANGAPVTVMGIDPATFGRFAYLDKQQRTAVTKLADGGAAAAIWVYAPAPTTPTQAKLGQTTLPLHVVARTHVFPGLRGNYQPMLVVNRAALTGIDANLDRRNEAWTTDAEVAALSTAVQRDGYSIISALDAKIRVSNSGLLPLTWIFGYLRALAVLIGAVAIAGLVFALSARTRRRTVSYVMSRRMGLRPATHIASLLTELLLVVGLGWIAGTLAGLGGYAMLTRSLDLQPQLPPGAQFVLPTISLAATGAVVALLIALAAGGTHTAAERAKPADVLRLE